jgi:[CysO sulfur-carrier protein]-S-L-cysteine hydrolase
MLPNRYVLLVPRGLHAAMIEQAFAQRPRECCGLLAGTPGGPAIRATHLFPLTNAAEEPTIEYLSEAKSMFAADRAMRAANVEIVAVYHSHPTSAAVPSRKDCARNYSDHVLNLIISLKERQPEMRAWWLWSDGYEEGTWELADDDTKTDSPSNA